MKLHLSALFALVASLGATDAVPAAIARRCEGTGVTLTSVDVTITEVGDKWKITSGQSIQLENSLEFFVVDARTGPYKVSLDWLPVRYRARPRECHAEPLLMRTSATSQRPRTSRAASTSRSVSTTVLSDPIRWVSNSIARPCRHVRSRQTCCWWRMEEMTGKCL